MRDFSHVFLPCSKAKQQMKSKYCFLDDQKIFRITKTFRFLMGKLFSPLRSFRENLFANRIQFNGLSIPSQQKLCITSEPKMVSSEKLRQAAMADGHPPCQSLPLLLFSNAATFYTALCDSKLYL